VTLDTRNNHFMVKEIPFISAIKTDKLLTKQLTSSTVIPSNINQFNAQQLSLDTVISSNINQLTVQQLSLVDLVQTNQLLVNQLNYETNILTETNQLLVKQFSLVDLFKTDNLLIKQSNYETNILTETDNLLVKQFNYAPNVLSEINQLLVKQFSLINLIPTNQLLVNQLISETEPESQLTNLSLKETDYETEIKSQLVSVSTHNKPIQNLTEVDSISFLNLAGKLEIISNNQLFSLNNYSQENSRNIANLKINSILIQESQ